MEIKELLKKAIRLQSINLKTNEIPFNIFLKHTKDVLTLCFLESDGVDEIIVVETNNKGLEELRIIPKENIEYISIFYEFKPVKEDKDKMFR